MNISPNYLSRSMTDLDISNDRSLAVSKNDFLNLKIHTSDTMEVIQLLITKQIPFAVLSENSKQSTKGAIPSPNRILETPVLNVKANKEDLDLQDIYQKYIVDGIDTIPPKVEQIAAEIGMSSQKFKSLFMRKYGHPFYQLYVDKKMDHAAMLLRSGLRANAVSERIGYSHPIKFSKMFQKRFGITPKKYQMSQQGL